jgi:hypothetical protein
MKLLAIFFFISDTEFSARIFLTNAVAFVLAVDCFAVILEAEYIMAFSFTIQSSELKD